MVTCPLCRGEGKCEDWVKHIAKPPRPPLSDNDLYLKGWRAAAFVAVSIVAAILTSSIYNRANPEPPELSAQQKCAQTCATGGGRMKAWTEGHRGMVGDGKGGATEQYIPQKCECLETKSGN